MNPRNPESRSDSPHVESIRNILGLLLAGFVGTLNVLGLKSHELTTVLRNETGFANLVAALLLAALVSAVGSVLIRRRHGVNSWMAAGILALVLATVPLSTVVALTIPAGARTWSWRAGLVLSCVLAAVGLALLLRGTSRHSARRVPWQSVLLACSAVLCSSATYTAVRLESKSQLDTTRPQMSATVAHTGNTSVITMTVSASKLRKRERVGVLVRGFPRGGDRGCKPSEYMATCVLKACPPRINKCTHLFSGTLDPDSAGVIDKQVVSTVFPPDKYELLDLRATICEQVDTKGAEGCRYGHKEASLLVEVTLPGLPVQTVGRTSGPG